MYFTDVALVYQSVGQESSQSSGDRRSFGLGEPTRTVASAEVQVVEGRLTFRPH